jgi:hypothetical protein
MIALALWSLWFHKPTPIKTESFYSARDWLNDYRESQSTREKKEHVVISIDFFGRRIYEKRLKEDA